MPETLPWYVETQIAEIYRAVQERNRRDRNKKRTGKVVEVDAEKGLARIQIGEGRDGYPPLKTGWIPWKEAAMGGNKTHQPPKVGEQVVVMSENGDLTDAEIETSLPSDENGRVSTKDDEFYSAAVGDSKTRNTENLSELQVDEKSMETDERAVLIHVDAEEEEIDEPTVLLKRKASKVKITEERIDIDAPNVFINGVKVSL